MSNLNNTFLQDQQNAVPQDKVSVAKYELKIQHLNDLNKKIYLENEELKAKIVSLQTEQFSMLDCKIDENTVLNNLRKEIQKEKQKNAQLSKQNEQLSATILLNQQLAVQAQKQSNFYVSRYEQKILQMRQNLQMKELQVQTIQEKYQKFKFLSLPMNVKNSTKFSAELIKYQILIEDLIRQRNQHPNRDAQEIKQVLFQLNHHQMANKKSKKDRGSKAVTTTDIRSNLSSLLNDSPYGQLNQQKIDIIFLRMHFELRALKRKYRESLEQIAELKSKDKIMKQGYNTLTKQIQKVRIQNCQLTIQLEHATKKLQSTKDLNQIRSVGNIKNKRLTHRQNAEERIASQVSIEGNISSMKQKTKANLPSETKYDTLQVTKSHNFDQRIENIDNLLSMDSDPENMRNRRSRHDSNDQELSVCEQNSVDMSISLDTSGFLPPDRDHKEISQHILTGLIDKKVF